MNGIERHARRAAAASIAALAAASLAGAPDARAARGMEVALQDDAVFLNQSYYNRDRAIEQAKRLRVSRVRVNVRWIEALAGGSPDRPVYDWRKWDAMVSVLGFHGIRVQMTLTGPAPSWATGNRRQGIYKPNPYRFARFAGAAAAHFQGRVDRYSVWNEPNYRGWLAPKRTAPQRYRAMYVRAYRAIKSADGRAQVLIGETSPTGHARNAIAPLSFLRAITRRGRLRADGFAHHPYAYSVPPGRRFGGRNDVTMATLGRLNKALKRLARRGRLRRPRGGTVPLYLTEFGYHARGRHAISERRRASWTTAAFRIAARAPRVKEMLHYLLVEPAAGGFWHSRLVTRGGRAERPYRSLASWARGAARKHRIKRPPSRIPLPPPRP